MYEGSLVGAGAITFAVMGYVIANYRLDKDVGAQVRLNPKLLATILGETDQDIRKAIEFLCAPDLESTSKEEGGRRLIRIGEFDYRVVNGAKYTGIRNEEERREANCQAQKRVRERKKIKIPASQDRPASAGYRAREQAAIKAAENGDMATHDAIAAGSTLDAADSTPDSSVPDGL